MRRGWSLGADPNQVRGQSRKRIVTCVAKAEHVKNEVDSLIDVIPARGFFFGSPKLYAEAALSQRNKVAPR